MHQNLPHVFLALLLLSVRTAAASPDLQTRSVLDVSTQAGVSWQFKPEGEDWKPINVPDGGWRNQGLTCDAGDYRAHLHAPQFTSHQRLHLCFDGVNFGATVSAGPDQDDLKQIMTHVNGWVPFYADVSSVASPGADVIVDVHVDGRNKFRKNGKYTIAEGATWCPTLEDGIIRGVHWEVVPDVRIDDMFVKTSVTQHKLEAEVRLANDGTSSATCILKGQLTSAGPSVFSYPTLQSQAVTIPAGGTQTVALSAAWNLGRTSYWWPNVPYHTGYLAQLHRITCSLVAGSKELDDYGVDFGFREFQAKGPRYYLNGIRCNLRGDNLQEANFGTDAYGVNPGFGPPTAANAGWPKAVDNLERLNFTVMRIHQIPATEYMLDVCDRTGLMLVEESPLRGSEGGEDFIAGHDSMVEMDRELVLRDRNHPSVVIWSAANEWADPIKDTTAAIQQLDSTRPIIADGIGDIGAPYVNMQHYVGGLGVLPAMGGSPRPDRPYGETEAVWPMDNTLQGFAWMATGTVLRRLKGDADIRNYTLNNAWPNFVPGEGRETEILEKAVKHMDKDAKILPDIASPWTDLHIELMQTSYAPVAAYDIDFNTVNAGSDATGDWPTVCPKVEVAAKVERTIALFNDEFSGTAEQLSWSVHQGSPNGVLLDRGSTAVNVPLGSYVSAPITFRSPNAAGKAYLSLAVLKNGVLRFAEDRIGFQVIKGSLYVLPDGVYRIANRATGTFVRAVDSNILTALEGWASTGSQDEQWRVTNLGDDYVTIANVGDGLTVDVLGAAMDDNANVIQYPGRHADNQIWRVVQKGANAYCLVNKNSGKLLDLYGGQSQNGARIEQWTENEGQNQQWTFEK